MIFKQGTRKYKKGFTLIEVVLVFAIAGLILIMVLIALPTLQRGQRNTQRKRDIALIAAQMDKWRSGHSGTSVSDNYSKRWDKNGFCTFMKHYVPEDMVDPSTGKPYRAALWNTKKSVNCYDPNKRDEIDRGAYDETTHGRSPNSHWAKMDVGDIQFDDVALCNGDTFDDDLGRSAGIHAFAFRIYLEGGAINCVDNGNSSLKKTSMELGPEDPINAFGFGSNLRFYTYN